MTHVKFAKLCCGKVELKLDSREDELIIDQVT